MFARLINTFRREYVSRDTKFALNEISMLINPWHIYRRTIHNALIRDISIYNSKDVLDVGCGCKPYEAMFYSASRYVGIDVEQTGHDHSNSKVDYYFDGHNIPFEDDSFDIIVMFEVLEHVPDITQTISEIRRVLKPNGQVVITMPFIWPEHEIPYDFNRLTSIQFRRVFEEQKFKCLSYQKNVNTYHSLMQLLLNEIVINYRQRWFFPIFLPIIPIINIAFALTSSKCRDDANFYLFHYGIFSNPKTSRAKT